MLHNFKNTLQYSAKKSIKKSLKLVAIFGILSLGTNIFNPLQGLACDITQARAEVQTKIDTLERFIQAPSRNENNQKLKDNLSKIKNLKLSSYLEKYKTQIIETAKAKFGQPAINDIPQDFGLEINNLKISLSKITALAKVTIVTDYKNGIVASNIYEYNLILDVKTKKLVVTYKPEIFANNTEPATEEVVLTEEQVKAKEEIAKSVLKETIEDSLKRITTDHRPAWKIEQQNLKKSLNSLSICDIAVQAGGNYNRVNAVKYAKDLAYDNSRNYVEFDATSGGTYLGGDCTNFASQALQSGGYKNTAKWHSESRNTANGKKWKNNSNRFTTINGTPVYVSSEFRGVTKFKDWSHGLTQTSDFYYWKNWKADGGIYKTNKNKAYDTLWENMFNNNRVTDGDIVWADWKNDGTWDHTMVITGWYWNNQYQKQIPLLSYHTSDTKDKDFIKIKDENPIANFVTNKFNTLY